MQKEVIEEKKRKSLKYSNYAGASAGAMDGSGNSYISPFAIAMNASNSQIGLLSSIPNLLAPFIQLWSTKAMEKFRSRKKIILFTAIMGSLMWIPILLTPFLFLKNGPIILIIVITIFSFFSSFIDPPWVSLMGDLVPENSRGKYFGNRAKIVGLVSLVVALAAGFFLDIFPKSKVFYGFATLFLIAMIFRFISIFFISKMYEPKLVIQNKYQFSFFEFIKKMPYNNFGRFTIYMALINFAVFIASPFFSVYMLRDLNFSYSTYIIISTATAVTSLLVMPLWGKFGDRHGNIKILKLTGIFIAFVPILWLFSSNKLYLVAVHIYSGLVWSGFNISSANFLFDSTSPQRRAACDAYFNILVGIGVFLGAGLGGLLSTSIQISFMNILLFIFVISTLARLSVSLFFLPKIKEVRELREEPILHISSLHIRGFTHNIVHFNKKK